MSKRKFELINKQSHTLDKNIAQKFEKAKQQQDKLESFLNEFIMNFLSEQTKKAYLTDLRSFFDFVSSGGEVIHHPNDITSYHFQVYRDYLIEREYTSATINRKLVAIRSFIKWAVAAKLMQTNPLDTLKLPKVRTHSPTIAFDDQEVNLMIDSIDLSTKKGPLHKLIMMLLFNLGLRRSELVSIKMRDIFKDRGHTILAIKGKGEKERYLPLNPALIDTIDSYLQRLTQLEIKLEADDYLIQSMRKRLNKKPMDGSTIYRLIKRYAAKCNIDKDVSPHSCRATAISHLLDTAQTPIRDVAIFAGHSNITTTERYDKRRDNLDRSAAYQVDYKKSS